MAWQQQPQQQLPVAGYLPPNQAGLLPAGVTLSVTRGPVISSQIYPAAPSTSTSFVAPQQPPPVLATVPYTTETSSFGAPFPSIFNNYEEYVRARGANPTVQPQLTAATTNTSFITTSAPTYIPAPQPVVAPVATTTQIISQPAPVALPASFSRSGVTNVPYPSLFADYEEYANARLRHGEATLTTIQPTFITTQPQTQATTGGVSVSVARFDAASAYTVPAQLPPIQQQPVIVPQAPVFQQQFIPAQIPQPIITQPLQVSISRIGGVVPQQVQQQPIVINTTGFPPGAIPTAAQIGAAIPANTTQIIGNYEVPTSRIYTSGPQVFSSYDEYCSARPWPALVAVH